MSQLGDTTALILAGGLGTRLRPVVGDRPKALAEVHGRPFVAYMLDGLAAAGVREVILCTGFMGEQIQASLGTAHGPLHLAYSHESEPCGTAGALRLATPLVGSRTTLVLNGDSLSDVNLENFSSWTLRQGAVLAVAVVRVADTRRFGCVESDAGGWVRRFEEKSAGRGAGWINAGIYLIDRTVLDGLSPDTPLSLEHDVLPTFVGNGLAAFQSDGRFLDIGTPETYARAPGFVGI